MRSRCRPLFLLSLLAASLWPGCGNMGGRRDWVTVESMPQGALVHRGRELLGTTPLTVALDRRDTHELRLARPQFRSARVVVAPMRNEAGRAFIRSGILEDLGAYHELGPNPVRVELVPLLVPESRPANPYGEFARRVLEADALLASGELSADEHRYIMDCLTRHFENL